MFLENKRRWKNRDFNYNKLSINKNIEDNLKSYDMQQIDIKKIAY